VTSFSQEHAPPSRPLGPEIPAGVRQAIASWFRDRGVDANEVRHQWFQQIGYGDVTDVEADVRDRWGENTATLLRRDLEDDPFVSQWNYGPRRQAAATAIVQRHVPAPLYLDYVERAIEAYVRERAVSAIDYLDDIIDDPRGAVVQYLNGLVATRRIDYRFDENGRARWHGDEGAYSEIIRPALDALDDDRLAGPRQEFESALGHLRAGTPKDQEAIEEAGKAVESAMKVLLAERQVSRSGNETAEPLWNLLRDNSIVPPKTKDAILSTSRLRNEYGGHGQGAEIREIPEGIPALAVRSAAAAITYLAELLP
jgi:Domain of unknown function (DUF7014)